MGLRCSCVTFFFSSRRRHTRFDCDWSSDVCSSDLDCRRRSAKWRRLQRSRSTASRAGCRSEEHTSELQSQSNLVCRLLLEKKKKNRKERNGTQRSRGTERRAGEEERRVGSAM